MKNILTISQHEFQQCLCFIEFVELKRLLETIFKFIKRNHFKMTDDQIHDLERKQTKIMREFMRRGILNKETHKEFEKWLYSTHEKRFY